MRGRGVEVGKGGEGGRGGGGGSCHSVHHFRKRLRVHLLFFFLFSFLHKHLRFMGVSFSTFCALSSSPCTLLFFF